MTSTISPYDTGDILRGDGETTTNLTFRTQGPLLRRPDATGEISAVPGTYEDAQPIAPLERAISTGEIAWNRAAGAVAAPDYVGLHRRHESLWDRFVHRRRRAVVAVRTIIAPSGHVHDVAAHQLTDTEAARIAAALAKQGIHVAPAVDVFHTVHLWAQQPTSTEQEVRALAAFAAVTDARLAWHEAGAA